MSKMRKFEFWNETEQKEDTYQLGLKRAVKSVQSKFKDKFISVKYVTKKGKELTETIMLPWGRKKKLER